MAHSEWSDNRISKSSNTIRPLGRLPQLLAAEFGMLPTTRRQFLKLATTAVAGWAGYMPTDTQATPTFLQSGAREYRGNNLSGWATVLGDGIYAAPLKDWSWIWEPCHTCFLQVRKRV